MKHESYLDRLIAGGTFRFDRLDINGIDNEPVFRLNVPEMVEQETCLFYRDVSSGNQYKAQTPPSERRPGRPE